jgi:hypothetical protein
MHRPLVIIMTAEQTQKLAYLLVFAFAVPAVGYVFGRLWSASVSKRFGGATNPKVERIARTFFLALPIFVICTYVRDDFENLEVWWRVSPLLVSGLALLFLGIIPLVLGVMIYRLWAGGRVAEPSR